MRFSFITKNILFLSLISFFTDVASEMLYPIIPLYLSSIGINIAGIGILEGIAETIAALSKTYFGVWSDKIKKRKIFVIIGYGLSGLSKPLMVFFNNYFWIMFMRVSDRFGKGIRTAPRDAILSDESSSSNKGKVFGFHRSIDTFGAAVGPAITLMLISVWQFRYENLFLLSFIPGILAILFSFLIVEKRNGDKKEKVQKIKFKDLWNYWKISSKDYKIVVVLLIVFYLFNSSDMLLLLRTKLHNFQDSQIIWLYIIYNISYAVFAFPFGMVGDKLGLKNTIAFGVLFFSIMYVGISIFQSWFGMVILFILYGVYSAAIEGNIKALISNLSDKTHTGAAIGLFTTLQSLTYLISNTLTGWLWVAVNPDFPFVMSGIVAFCISIILFSVKIKPVYPNNI